MRCMIYMYINVQIIFISESCRNISVAFMPKQTCRYVWEKITDIYVYLFFKLKVFLRSNVLWKEYTTPLLCFVLILNFPSFASSFNILPIISPPDVRLLFFSKDSRYYIAEIPPNLQGKIRRKMKCYKHLLKDTIFPWVKWHHTKVWGRQKYRSHLQTDLCFLLVKKTPNKKPPKKQPKNQAILQLSQVMIVI